MASFCDEYRLAVCLSVCASTDARCSLISSCKSTLLRISSHFMGTPRLKRKKFLLIAINLRTEEGGTRKRLQGALFRMSRPNHRNERRPVGHICRGFPRFGLFIRQSRVSLLGFSPERRTIRATLPTSPFARAAALDTSYSNINAQSSLRRVASVFTP